MPVLCSLVHQMLIENLLWVIPQGCRAILEKHSLTGQQSRRKLKGVKASPGAPEPRGTLSIPFCTLQFLKGSNYWLLSSLRILWTHSFGKLYLDFFLYFYFFFSLDTVLMHWKSIERVIKTQWSCLWRTSSFPPCISLRESSGVSEEIQSTA